MQHEADSQSYKSNPPKETLTNKAKKAGHKTNISDLHKKIFVIENSISKSMPGEAGLLDAPSQWRLGVDDIDDKLPWGGLCVGLHEVQPKDYRHMGSAIAFALALVSRLAPSPLSTEGTETTEASCFLLWCATTEAIREFGRPYGPGVASLGLDPARILFVDAGRRQDAAWAMEEGVKSQSLLAVVGLLPRLDFTSARRLSLASRKYGTPCLAIEAHDAPGLGPALSRWRVAGESSSASPFDARAPGFPAWRIALERCRHGMEQRHWNVEWRHDAHRFNLAAQFSAGATGLASGSEGSATRIRARG